MSGEGEVNGEDPVVQGWRIPPRWNCNPRTREENLSGTHDLVGNLEGEVQTRERALRQGNPYFFKGDGENVRKKTTGIWRIITQGNKIAHGGWPEWDPQIQETQDPDSLPRTPIGWT